MLPSINVKTIRYPTTKILDLLERRLKLLLILVLNVTKRRTVPLTIPFIFSTALLRLPGAFSLLLLDFWVLKRDVGREEGIVLACLAVR